MASPYGVDDKLPTPTNPITPSGGSLLDRGLRAARNLFSNEGAEAYRSANAPAGTVYSPTMRTFIPSRGGAATGLPDSAPSAAPSAPVQTPTLRDTGAGAGRGFVNPPLVDPAAPRPAQPDQVRELGDGMRRIDRAGQSPLYTNVTQGDPFQFPRVSVVPSAPAVAAAGGQPASPAQPGGMTVIEDSGAAERAARNLRLDREKISDALDDRIRLGGNSRGNQAAIGALGRNLEAFDRGVTDRSVAATRAGSDLAVAGLRDQGETTRASAQMAVLADNNRRTTDATLRGQDMDLYGRQLSARNQRAQLAADQMNKDRQFALDVSKFGEEKAKTMHAQREEGNKAFRDWAGSTFVGTDGKPDAARVADFETAAVQTVGNMITRLQQKGDADSLKKAEELQSRGLGALDAQDRATLRTLFERRQRFTETRGNVNPFSASGPVSNDLQDYAITGQENGLVQRRVTTAGGQSIPVNDLRYTEPANTFLPDIGKTPTTTLGPTLDEQNRMKRGLR